MPKAVHDLAKKLMRDPDFKPKYGRTKEQAAWAVATAQLAKAKLKRARKRRSKKRR